MSKQEKSQANEKEKAIVAARMSFKTWPDQLESGVMFYNGERITRAEFEGRNEDKPISTLPQPQEGLGVQPDIKETENELVEILKTHSVMVYSDNHSFAGIPERELRIVAKDILSLVQVGDIPGLTLTDDSGTEKLPDLNEYRRFVERVQKVVDRQQERIEALEKQLKAANDRYARREQKYYEWPKQRDELKAEVRRYEKSLREIAAYDKNSSYGEGCCPHGCDTPNIAREALKKPPQS